MHGLRTFFIRTIGACFDADHALITNFIQRLEKWLVIKFIGAQKKNPSAGIGHGRCDQGGFSKRLSDKTA